MASSLDRLRSQGKKLAIQLLCIMLPRMQGKGGVEKGLNHDVFPALMLGFRHDWSAWHIATACPESVDGQMS